MAREPLPPQDDRAEESVLGGILAAAAFGRVNAYEEAADVLRSAMFYRHSHGLIFDACSAVYLADHAPDALGVISQLEHEHLLDKAGGRIRVLELARSASAFENIRHHAEIVKATWERRVVVERLKKSLDDVYAGSRSEHVLDAVEREIMDVRQLLEHDRKAVISSQEIATYWREKMANPVEGIGRGVPTPFPSFIPSFQGGRLYTLGGYPADGKTVLAVQCARAACAGAKRVGIASIEMDWRDLADRMIATYGVPYNEAMTGRVSERNRHEAEFAAEQLEKADLDVIDDPVVTVEALHRYCRVGKFDLVIVDHLHRMGWEERRDLERIVTGITNIARQFAIPVLMLCQLRRPQGEGFPRPTLASLRDTALIEAESAMVLFIWRERDEKKLPTGLAEVIVAKNRFGPTGSYGMHFWEERVMFTQLERAHAA